MEESNLEVRKAFALALADMPNLHKDATGSTGKRDYRYMQLPTMLTEVKPVLDRHGLAMYQYVERDEYGAGVVTCFTHKDTGQTLCLGSYPLAVSMKPQDQGSALTYARRYSLMTALGVMPDEDDDGAAAQAAALSANHAPAAGGGDFIDADTFANLRQGIEVVAGVDPSNIMGWISDKVGHPVTRGGQLTVAEGQFLGQVLNGMAGN